MPGRDSGQKSRRGTAAAPLDCPLQTGFGFFRASRGILPFAAIRRQISGRFSAALAVKCSNSQKIVVVIF
jgi:hypothetical protein